MPELPSIDFSKLQRFKQYDRILYRGSNDHARMYDEALFNEGRPARNFSYWQILPASTPGLYRLKILDRVLYQHGDCTLQLYDESLSGDGRPGVEYSEWTILPGTVDGTVRLSRGGRILYRAGNIDIYVYDEGRDDEGRPSDIGFSNWNVFEAEPTTGTTAGEILQAIIQDTTVTPYPAFSGDQLTAYNYLVAQFNQNIVQPITDLRTDVYPHPLTYAPSTVYSNVHGIAPPANIPAAAWTAVHEQIQSEVSSLVNLLQFQNEFATSANSVATEWNARFQTAVDTLNSRGSGTLNFLDLCNQAFSTLGEDDPDVAPIGTVMGSFFSAAQKMANANGCSDDVSGLQSTLNQLIEDTVTSAQNIYPPIAADWGKLQKFQALANLPTTSATLTKDTITAIGKGYEISIYQAVMPSNMAIVWFSQYSFGDSGGSQDGVGVAYTPESHGMAGKNDDLCRRLVALGINLDDVINRAGRWDPLASWVCTSSMQGTHCREA